MSRGPGPSGPVFPLYRLQPLRVGPQDLTRRAAGRRLAPSFLVLQSEKAQPHFGGALYWSAGPQAAILDRRTPPQRPQNARHTPQIKIDLDPWTSLLR